MDALVKGLRQAGWIVGHNVKIDIRWASGETARLRAQALEMLALTPDVIVAGGRAATVVPVIQQAGSSIQIVFVQGLDPVGSGYVASLSRPGGNATGFTQFEYSSERKWLQLLKEIAPRTVRAAIIRESGPAGVGQWAVIQSVASSMAVEISPVDTRDPARSNAG